MGPESPAPLTCSPCRWAVRCADGRHHRRSGRYTRTCSVESCWTSRSDQWERSNNDRISTDPHQCEREGLNLMMPQQERRLGLDSQRA